MSSFDIYPAEGLAAVKIIVPRRHQDPRGFFSEVWRQDAMAAGGIEGPFVQENHALSREVGTVRGLHFQIGESAQAKLIRCSRGSVFDVAVDIRRGSPTYGRHVAIEISAENWRQLFVPIGFAHGYCTREPNSEVIYKVSSHYDRDAERGLLWDDPALGIKWPVDRDAAILVDRDRSYPRLENLPDFFSYTNSMA